MCVYISLFKFSQLSAFTLPSVFKLFCLFVSSKFDQFVRIPAYGINDNNYAHDNFRDPSDIWVQQENDPKRTYEEIQAMKRRRTVDRYILVGTHDVTKDGKEKEEGVVGEEIYFLNVDQSPSLRSWSTLYLGLLGINIFLNIFLVDNDI